MPEALLRTKLFVPPARPQLVPRARLIDRLDRGLQQGHRLLLISAPAGFGKTTLAAAWLRRLQSADADHPSPRRVAWLSLDSRDNDPTRFLSYLVAALQTLESHLGVEARGTLEASQTPPPEPVLTLLINEIDTLPYSVLLVLDDFHLIEDRPVHDVVDFLLENLPQRMQLVIATREDPPLPLSRLRARAQLTELRAADLRFSSAEASAFLNQIMDLGLSAEHIAALASRTEGWITGLQLAAISMRGKSDAARFISSFTGSHRYILDYLIEEVLGQQPAHITAFLLQTAILNRLTGPLCAAVTGQSDSQEILQELERANLFIVPLDQERRWYRYHHLFAELLLQQSQLIDLDASADLHAKAAGWYEAHGLLSEAIHHAFAGGDVATATRLIEKGALDALERSEFGFILNAVDRLPAAVLERSPWLFVYHAWALLLTGQIAAAAPRVEDTDWLLAAVGEDEIKQREMAGYIAGLKEHLTGWQRAYGQMFVHAEQAAELLPADHWIRGYCAMGLGTAYWGRGDLAAAMACFREAAQIGKASGNRRVALTSADYVGISLEMEGRLQEAISHFERSFDLALQDGRELPLAAYLHAEFARVLYELDELDRAARHLEAGIKHSQRLADGRIERIGLGTLTRIHLARGDTDRALSTIRRAEEVHPIPDESSIDMRGGEYLRVRLWLKLQRLSDVEAWLRDSDLEIHDVAHFKTRMTYTMHARAMIALGLENASGLHLKRATTLLNALLVMAESHGWGKKVVEICALQALALAGQGESTRSRAALERALRLAEPEGFCRTFVDEGAPMARLLQDAAAHGITPGYPQRLLAAFPSAAAARSAPAPDPAAGARLVEPLSDREIEVLQHIAAGLSNREIADRLFLSLNTVKVHTRNIYGKLGVHKRTQAVARARALALLSSN